MSARARARQSNGPSAASRATQATAAPPAYEPPTYPLNPNAQRALAHLAQTHSLRKLKEHLGAASDCLTEDVGKVNDRVHDRSEKMHKRVGKNQEKGAEPNEELEELERQLQDVKDRAEKMTQRMDESMRKIIDGEQSVQNMEDILKAVSNQAMTASQAAQHSQSQQRRRRAAQADGDDEDEEMPDFDPTDPAGGAVTQNRQAFSLNEAFRTRLQDEKDRYQTRSLGDRYSTNNRYIGFKRTVHDALNPGEDAPPMPHAATWFNEGNTPAPGVTEAGNAHEDSDDDIAIARERISTKCPLTLQEFRQPVTSKKCPHTFEKEAIISLIGRRPQVQCPVPGCGHTIGISDLHTDPILVRKIRRIQKSRQAEEEDDGLASSPPRRASANRAESVASDSDGEDIDAMERRTQQAKSVKDEPRSTMPPRSTAQVVDLGGESDADDDDDDVTDEE